MSAYQGVVTDVKTEVGGDEVVSHISHDQDAL